MPVYKYIAISKEGGRISGKITADNEVELDSIIQKQGAELISAKKSGTRSFSLLKFFRISGGRKIKDLIFIFTYMAQLEKSGVPILEALEDLRDSLPDNSELRMIIDEVYNSIKGGSSLSEAFSVHKNFFDAVSIGLIKVGERSGQLYEIYKSIIHYIKWQYEIKRKTIKALIYPSGMIVLMFGIILTASTLIVPKIAAFLIDQGIKLPMQTIILMKIADVVLHDYVFLIVVPIITILTITIIKNRVYSFRYFLHRVKLKLPIVGNVLLKIDTSRFVNFFALLYNSGIGIVEAMEVSGNLVKSLPIKEKVLAITEKVKNGTSLFVSFKEAKIFPSLVSRMIKVGEESGDLSAGLDNIRYFYDQEVDNTIETMISAIKPISTILIGLIVMWLASAILGPIYGSFTKMQGL